MFNVSKVPCLSEFRFVFSGISCYPCFYSINHLPVVIPPAIHSKRDERQLIVGESRSWLTRFNRCVAGWLKCKLNNSIKIFSRKRRQWYDEIMEYSRKRGAFKIRTEEKKDEGKKKKRRILFFLMGEKFFFFLNRFEEIPSVFLRG